MSLHHYTDPEGNELRLIRCLPSWSMTLQVTSPSGTSVEVDLSGLALLEVAESLAGAAAAQVRLNPAAA